ncbi:hypothetical protein CDAR_574451 [Caerostris darwini]|uniref:Uncharacterized protein n=1 Tax=Caerostris darwini TaxID=1538125 RepID=A0AAV4UI67_9ARAC|nr:hypothetical protein CDAR_574451 [Caerostris darwini]
MQMSQEMKTLFLSGDLHHKTFLQKMGTKLHKHLFQEDSHAYVGCVSLFSVFRGLPFMPLKISFCGAGRTWIRIFKPNALRLLENERVQSVKCSVEGIRIWGRSWNAGQEY